MIKNMTVTEITASLKKISDERGPKANRAFGILKRLYREGFHSKLAVEIDTFFGSA